MACFVHEEGRPASYRRAASMATHDSPYVCMYSVCAYVTFKGKAGGVTAKPKQDQNVCQLALGVGPDCPTEIHQI